MKLLELLVVVFLVQATAALSQGQMPRDFSNAVGNGTEAKKSGNHDYDRVEIPGLEIQVDRKPVRKKSKPLKPELVVIDQRKKPKAVVQLKPGSNTEDTSEVISDAVGPGTNEPGKDDYERVEIPGLGIQVDRKPVGAKSKPLKQEAVTTDQRNKPNPDPVVKPGSNAERITEVSAAVGPETKEPATRDYDRVGISGPEIQVDRKPVRTRPKHLKPELATIGQRNKPILAPNASITEVVSNGFGRALKGPVSSVPGISSHGDYDDYDDDYSQRVKKPVPPPAPKSSPKPMFKDKSTPKPVPRPESPSSKPKVPTVKPNTPIGSKPKSKPGSVSNLDYQSNDYDRVDPDSRAARPPSAPKPGPSRPKPKPPAPTLDPEDVVVIDDPKLPKPTTFTTTKPWVTRPDFIHGPTAPTIVDPEEGTEFIHGPSLPIIVDPDEEVEVALPEYDETTPTNLRPTPNHPKPPQDYSDVEVDYEEPAPKPIIQINKTEVQAAIEAKQTRELNKLKRSLKRMYRWLDEPCNYALYSEIMPDFWQSFQTGTNSLEQQHHFFKRFWNVSVDFGKHETTKVVIGNCKSKEDGHDGCLVTKTEQKKRERDICFTGGLMECSKAGVCTCLQEPGLESVRVDPDTGVMDKYGSACFIKEGQQCLIEHYGMKPIMLPCVNHWLCSSYSQDCVAPEGDWRKVQHKP